ncbi:MAG: flagellar motor switch protein FliN, partial [Bacillota bacterium]
MPAYTQPPMVEQAPKQQVHAAAYNYKPLGVEQKAAELGIDENNLELIMSVPVQITVELGKTKKKIKDIAELTVGNIVELNRQAGDQVDVVANGRLIARGDVVVVDDNYSVRITEIIKAKDNNSIESK